MTCPKCHSELDSRRRVPGVRRPPDAKCFRRDEDVGRDDCGARRRGFYRSVQEVPEPLRTQLIETTTSPNSGTIVIADRAGKEQLTQVMARREAGAGRN